MRLSRQYPVSLVLVTLVLTFLASCDRSNVVPDKDVPEWLKERIEADEATIADNPALAPNYGAWYRYQFGEDYYFEYYNPLSSSAREPYDEDGDIIDLTDDYFQSYMIDRCCRKLVWRAPMYQDIND